MNRRVMHGDKSPVAHGHPQELGDESPRLDIALLWGF